MPRPKSELTDSVKVISARITQDMFKEWRKLGGAEWLRKQLSSNLQRNKSHEQTAKTLSQ